VSREYADGAVYLTQRANLQLRALPRDPAARTALHPEALAAIEATGLLPSRSHELVRNIVVSPQTRLDLPDCAGRANLGPVADQLDQRLLADPDLARLPGRFLFTLDDGRGDLLDRMTGAGKSGTDLGVVALDDREGQLRVGHHWGAVVPLRDAAAELAAHAAAFVTARGTGPDAPWHVRELASPLVVPLEPDPRLPAPSGPLSYGAVAGGTHVPVPNGVLTAGLAEALLGQPCDLVVTPWHGVLVPQETP
jgi:precorrin-3B synthase